MIVRSKTIEIIIYKTKLNLKHTSNVILFLCSIILHRNLLVVLQIQIYHARNYE